MAEAASGDGDIVHDVAVIGLGPVGMALAGLLGRRGLRVIGLERAPAIYPMPRAGHVDHTVLRTLDEIGCLDEALADMVPNAGLSLVAGDGRLLARVPAQPRTPSGLPSSMHFHQPSLDRTLRRCLQAMEGVALRTSARVVDLTQDASGVRLTVEGAEGPRVVRARHAVGCDGASSAVRALAGLGFDDYGFSETWLVVDLILRGRPDTLPPDDTTFGADPARPWAAIDLPGMRYRFEFMLLPGETAEAMAQPATVLRLTGRWLAPAQIQRIERAVVYTFRGGQARPWRAGRVLLAGDAAHLTPPFLGQGLCSGVRDAANLAWKFEHVLRLGAPEVLLDSYEAERGPHVENVIRTSMRLAQALCEHDPERAARRDAEMLGSGAPPERRLTFRLGELVAGPLVLAGGGMFMPSPDVVTEAGPVPLDRVVGPCFQVLARDARALDDTADWWRGIGARMMTLDELRCTDDTLERWFARREASVAVVRPDRYVLGAGDALAPITAQVAGLLAGGEVAAV